MELNLQQFITENASAIFALLSVLGGGILSFVGALLLKKRDFNLRKQEVASWKTRKQGVGKQAEARGRVLY